MNNTPPISKNEEFHVPSKVYDGVTKEVHWLQIIQTIVLFMILAINMFFLLVVWQGMSYSTKNKQAVDLILEKLQDKNVIDQSEKNEIQQIIKETEVSPDGKQEKSPSPTN